VTIFSGYIMSEERLIIQGPIGPIEAIQALPKEMTVSLFGVICHPHSLHGGTMQNKVVTTISRMFREMGIASIRFNFRGVGDSAGEYDAGIGETEDLLAVLSWVKDHYLDHDICLVGFSFGSFVAYRAASQWPISRLILIAPPVHHYDYIGQPIPKCPWIVVQGEADEVVPPDKVFAWVKSLSKPPTLIRMPNTSHFFHGKLVDLRSELRRVLAAEWH